MRNSPSGIKLYSRKVKNTTGNVLVLVLLLLVAVVEGGSSEDLI